MKTEQEIRQMVNACNLYRNCGGCPYNPEDISRFIGRGRWKGGCPNYDRKLVYAMGKGYGDVSEYKAEIEQLKTEYEKLQTNAEILAQGVRDFNHENYELTEKVKQAQTDTINTIVKYCENPNHWRELKDCKLWGGESGDLRNFLNGIFKEIEQ